MGVPAVWRGAIGALRWFCARVLAPGFARGIYRIRVVGAANRPRAGAALLVSNHVSFIDAFLITIAARRFIRFLMFRVYYDFPPANLFFRAMGCIPLSHRDSPRSLLESLRLAREALNRGEAVCIFAEGEISRHGQLLRFKRGLERITKGLSVPIVPVHLDQVWGSIFSFRGGKAIWKRPRRWPYPVTVSFGRPLPPETEAFRVRLAIQELSCEAFQQRLSEHPSLAVSFLRQARSHGRRLAMADSSGIELSYGRTLAAAWRWTRHLRPRLKSAPAVGVLLPPSVPAALANLSLALLGHVPVNLDYTRGSDMAYACAAKSGASHTLTSRRFLERLGWPIPEGAVYVEDIPSLEAWPSFWPGICPEKLAVHFLFPRALKSLEELATVIFTSGTTSLPKGVQLTEANIISNVEAVRQMFELGPGDRLLGALPFFHAFGLTATLWTPLSAGLGVVYHDNPLDSQKIGDLVSRYRVTFFPTTPTLLAHYLKRVGPDKFRSLRHVIVGAEKLRKDLAEAFAARFGIEPLEGYGATELSPVASVNIPDIDWPGTRQRGTKPGTIGHPLPGVSMKVVDPHTGEDLAPGQPGLLLVKGPNVMKGYLGDEAATKAVLKDGYYVTSDVAAIDEDGFVTIVDRLARFSKIGGQMVPHLAVEERLQELSGEEERVFAVLGAPDEKHGEKLVVFYTGELDIKKLSRELAQSGIPKLWIPSPADFHRIEKFPLLGSGKLDIAQLKSMAAA